VTTKKSKSAVTYATALLLPILAVAWLFDLNPFSSATTVYSIYCGKDTGEEGRCIDLQPVTYRALPDRQSVDYWTTDAGISVSFTDCIVRDRTNWECWYKDRGGRFSMVGGTFREEVIKDIPGKDTFDSVRYVSKWKWWAIKFGVYMD